MNVYAILDPSNVVANVIVREVQLAPRPNLVQVQDGEPHGIGWTFDANAVPRFIAPPERNSWTAYQFLLRFTAAERAAFRAAAITDANVADFQQLAQAAQEIVSDDPMTVSGMNYLVSVGLLTEQRKQEILS
jgi:hypothetical protein